jgi:hypothetical protein
VRLVVEALSLASLT